MNAPRTLTATGVARLIERGILKDLLTSRAPISQKFVVNATPRSIMPTRTVSMAQRYSRRTIPMCRYVRIVMESTISRIHAPRNFVSRHPSYVQAAMPIRN